MNAREGVLRCTEDRKEHPFIVQLTAIKDGPLPQKVEQPLGYSGITLAERETTLQGMLDHSRGKLDRSQGKWDHSQTKCDHSRGM